MGIGKFLIGCALCVGGVGAASAMDADGQDMATMQHGMDSSASSHDGAGSGGGGDALGLSREGASQSNPASSSSSDNCPTTNSSTPAARGRHAHLGWQSLLPGSIQ